MIFKDKLALTCSFAGETPVSTVCGKQAIATLQRGDRVLAYNLSTHKMEPQAILQVLTHPDADLVELTITSQPSGQQSRTATRTSEIVHTNQKHPFLTVEKGFAPVSDITVGMHLKRSDGTMGVVTARKLVPGTATMYNLEVANDHTFVVGDGTAVSMPEERLGHSYNSHAHEWFGRDVGKWLDPNVKEADKAAWKDLLTEAMKSKQIFPWTLRGNQGPRPTIAVLARLKNGNQLRYFVVQFFRDTGELGTAFSPNQDQLNAMLKLLQIAGRG